MNLLTDILILFILAGLCLLTVGGTIWLLQGGRDTTEDEPFTSKDSHDYDPRPK